MLRKTRENHQPILAHMIFCLYIYVNFTDIYGVVFYVNFEQQNHEKMADSQEKLEFNFGNLPAILKFYCLFLSKQLGNAFLSNLDTLKLSSQHQPRSGADPDVHKVSTADLEKRLRKLMVDFKSSYISFQLLYSNHKFSLLNIIKKFMMWYHSLRGMCYIYWFFCLQINVCNFCKGVWLQCKSCTRFTTFLALYEIFFYF